MNSSGTFFNAPSDDISLPQKYIINMAWINSTLQENDPYIFPCKTKEELIEKYLGRAIKWQTANPDATIYIWYDSSFTTKKAIHDTLAVLNTLNENNKATVMLMDIRNLDIVIKNPDSFSDNVPIYVRVDLIKLIVCVHAVEKEQSEVGIFSDFDVGELRPDKGRMNKTELFTPDVMKKLSTYGFELGKDSIEKAENQFIQLMNKPEVILAFKLTIDATLVRIVFILNLAKERSKKYLNHLNSGTVFVQLKEQTRNLVYGLLATDEGDKILINLQVFDWNRPAEWVPFDPYKHGCAALGNFYKGYTNSDLHIITKVNDDYVIHAVSDAIKLPESYPAFTLGRNDMDTRGGGSHDVDLEKIKDREPANGKEYQCSLFFTPLTKESLIISSEHHTRQPPL